MITVASMSILNSLKIHDEGDEAFVISESKIYRYSDGEWKAAKTPEGKLNISIYEMNKMVVAQLPEAEDKQVLETVRRYANDCQGKYFMLICKDLNYYTLFVRGEGEGRLEKEALDCMHDIGTVKSAERIEDTDVVELWVEPKDEEPVAMYFFNYEKGVVLCK